VGERDEGQRGEEAGVEEVVWEDVGKRAAEAYILSKKTAAKATETS
jgi:hypothetical protein